MMQILYAKFLGVSDIAHVVLQFLQAWLQDSTYFNMITQTPTP